MHSGRVILVVLMLLLSGCSGVLDANTASPTETTSSVTTTQQTSETDTEKQSSSSETAFSEQSATGEMLIEISQLPSGYVLDGESIETRSEVENETAEMFQERGMTRLHDRVYLRDDSETDGAGLVLVSAAVFESNGDATDYLNSFTNSIEANGTAETIDIGENGSAQKVRFTNDRGLQNVVIIARVGNMVFYIVSSDSERYYDSQARELFITMYADAEQRADGNTQ